jgi:enamine deaminase RidA (YjgF/YER057c/UK114 family)
MVKGEAINPPALGSPTGYSHGMRIGEFIFVAGQIGGEPIGQGRVRLVSSEFAPQFERALANVLEVVRTAGGSPTSLVEMTVYVKDMEAYRRSRRELGEIWGRLVGREYPAMTLVAVSDLYEAGALVEIRAIAGLG